MSFNYAHYLYRRWNADRQVRGAVLWREYMAQYGADTPITIDAVRKLLREFRNENFSSVPRQVDLSVSSAEDHQLPETDDPLYPSKKPHLDDASAAADDHHHYNSEEMEVEDMDIFKKVDGDKKDDDKEEEEEDKDEDEDEDEDDEDEDEDEDDHQKGEGENDDNEKGDNAYDEEEGSVEKRIEKESNGDDDEVDLHGEDDDENSDKIREEKDFHSDALSDVLSARQSLVAALPSETKRAFVLYQYMKGVSLGEAMRSLQNDFGEVNFSRLMVTRWYKRFQSGDTSCQDKKGTGRPRRIEDEQFKGVIATNPFATPAEIAQNLDISSSTVYLRMKNLGYTLKLSRWVPHELTSAQKEKRVAFCRQLLDMLDKNPELLE
ncbi:hypothetical protein TYRP_022162 [Tyrophagus putrescentiae]|nr:hypothetical protein TYRP_022162 [Tyrophagus putrescentiae]